MSKKLEVINNLEFGLMINNAQEKLKNNAEKINKLNVFPVPDGDTGTNMSLSLLSAAEYERNEESESVGKLSIATSRGLLMGARGNSGVILSQFFRGFSKKIENLDTLSINDFTDAIVSGSNSAYQAIMEPTPGTILTVMVDVANKAKEISSDEKYFSEYLLKLLEEGRKSLKNTPNLLPVLKEVGVVDSGGQGFVLLLEAFYEVASGEVIESSLDTPPDNAEFNSLKTGIDAQVYAGKPEDIKFGYCTTILVSTGVGTTFTKDFSYENFYKDLENLGDSLLVIEDEGIVKAHVHTEQPGKVLEIGTSYGSLLNVKIDNMREQQQAVIDKNSKENKKQTQEKIEVVNSGKDLSIITVATGEGLKNLMRDGGADIIISGGQTMNPSTQDFVDAIQSAHSKEIIILPNNSNIFMAASQAAEVVNIDVQIIKTRTIQEGISALLTFNPEDSLANNADNMSESLEYLKSIEITKAVRDTTFQGKDIKDGEFISLIDGKLSGNDSKIIPLAKEVLNKNIDEDSELITIFYGSDSNLKEANKIKKEIQKIDKDIDVEIYDGGQPLYQILISIE